MNRFLFLLISSFIFISGYAQTWIEDQKITPPTRYANDNFWKVAIDGDYAAVTAYAHDYDLNDKNQMYDAGAVFVYHKNTNGNWIFHQKLVAYDRNNSELFGISVAIDSTTLMVGSYSSLDSAGQNTSNFYYSGGVYIFNLDSTGYWKHAQKIIPSPRVSEVYFGYDVSLSNNIAVIGCPGDSRDSAGIVRNNYYYSGSIVILLKDSNGVWKKHQRVRPNVWNQWEFLGLSVDIFDSTIVFGSSSHSLDSTNGNALSSAGAAYIFEPDSTGFWKETKKITPGDRKANDQLGDNCSIYEDWVAVSSRFIDLPDTGQSLFVDAGAVYIYHRDSVNHWKYYQKIIAPAVASRLFFGGDIDLSANRLLISATGFTPKGSPNQANSGAVFTYSLDSNNQWTYGKTIVSDQTNMNDEFGATIAQSGKEVLIGSSGQDFDQNGLNQLNNVGAAYFFRMYHTLDDTLTACNSHLFKGNTYSKTGIYGDTLRLNTSNPDTLTVLNLTVNYDSHYSYSASNCYDYASPSGKQWIQSGLYADTISNAIGCDSVMAVNLKILESTFSYSDTTVCDLFESVSGKFQWKRSGIYRDTIPNSIGCDSVITVELYVEKLDSSVVVSQNKLESVEFTADYQWHICDSSFTTVPGETKREMTPVKDGYYSLVISNAFCRDTSGCELMILEEIETSVLENGASNAISVYPNPTSGIISVNVKEGFENLEMALINILGEDITSHAKVTERQFDLSNYPDGIYFLKSTLNGQSTLFKIILNH